MSFVDNVREISPVQSVNGRVIVPGSKSMTHRALFMSALADGESEIRGPLKADDTELTARALEKLGVQISWNDDLIKVYPPSKRWNKVSQPIFLGNSGTSMRLLLGVLATGEGSFVLDGSPRMKERPVGPVIDVLERLGVHCSFLERRGYPPLELVSKGIKGGFVEVDARKSSQFLSSLLLAAPCAMSDVTVRWLNPVASFPYVKMTLRMMRERGIVFSNLDENTVHIYAPQIYGSGTFNIEGDCSSASYFWIAAAVTGGCVETVPVFRDSYQGDMNFLGVLEMMGCNVEWIDQGVRVCGPDRLLAVDVDMNIMPDMVPGLAVCAVFADGKTVIRNVSHLRIKESDRLSAVATELKKMGASVDIEGDNLIIRGGRKLQGTLIKTYNDHRIAMAFAIAGLRVSGVKIENPQVVSKSYPDFWKDFEELLYGQCPTAG